MANFRQPPIYKPVFRVGSDGSMSFDVEWAQWFRDLTDIATAVNSGGGGTGVVDAFVPYYIPLGQTWTVPVNKQALYRLPIMNDGTMLINGFLVEV